MGVINLKQRICFGSPGVFSVSSQACCACASGEDCKSLVTYRLERELSLPGAAEALSRITSESAENCTAWTSAVLKRLSKQALRALIDRGENPLGDTHPALQIAFLMAMRGAFTRRDLVEELTKRFAKKTAENHATNAIKTLVELGLTKMNGCRVAMTFKPMVVSQNQQLTTNRV